MSCSPCTLLDPAQAELPLEQFLAAYESCSSCPAVEAGGGASLVLHQRLLQTARSLRKVQSKLRQREQDLQEAQESTLKFEDRIHNMELLYKQSLRQLESQVSLAQRQTETIRALSAPLLDVGDGVLAMPVIGALDDERAARLSAAMLEGIALRRARFAILDLTGLEQVDAGTATILLRVCAAIRLLGTEIILCGLRSQVAKELVTLGSDLSAVQTVPTLRAALLRCRVAPR